MQAMQVVQAHSSALGDHVADELRRAVAVSVRGARPGQARLHHVAS